MFTLGEMAYFACSDEQKKWYNSVPNGVVKFDHGDCCNVFLRAAVHGVPIVPNDPEIKACLLRAVKIGHLSCFKKLNDLCHGYRHTISSMGFKVNCMAASGGHLDCLKYCFQYGYPIYALTVECAARGGHIDCLRYLCELGCPWEEDTCIAAASNGHLECLKYALEMGCRWSVRTVQAAEASGQTACLQYLIEQGSPRRL